MKIVILFILFSTILKSFAIDETILKPFTTDYCTSYPEGTTQQPDLWKHCCYEHDLYFWAGGSKEDRDLSDLRLKSCVEATGAVLQAQLIYMAVSIGGTSPVRFSTKQWGNAWTDRARYLKLNEEETHAVLHDIEINHPELPSTLRQSFIQQLQSRLE